MSALRRALLLIPVAAFLSPLALAAGDRTEKKIKPNHGRGEALFVYYCSTCHTFKEAGAIGVIGPNLDKYPPPSLAYVKYQITHGGGVMPAFTRFTPQDVADIAAFVWARK